MRPGDGVFADLALGHDVRRGGETISDDENDDDRGVTDKRLLVVEQELGAALRAFQRSGNNLSMILRMAFDGGTVEPLTKNNRTIATDPHINVLGHITRQELDSLLTATEIWNGLGNRFHTAGSRDCACPFISPPGASPPGGARSSSTGRSSPSALRSPLVSEASHACGPSSLTNPFSLQASRMEPSNSSSASTPAKGGSLVTNWLSAEAHTRAFIAAEQKRLQGDLFVWADGCTPSPSKRSAEDRRVTRVERAVPSLSMPACRRIQA
jgi:hypothetical protein